MRGEYLGMIADQMYTELIMMHNKSGHNKRELSHPDFFERGHNPNCGDDLTLQVNVKDGIVTEAAFIGSGCAISQAAMSIMIDLVTGKPIDEVKALTDLYLSMVRGETIDESDLEKLEDAQAFMSLSKMPARVKCGTLGWHCLDVVLDKIPK